MDKFTALKDARAAADELKTRLGIQGYARPGIAFVLGTGWGDLLELKGERTVPMKELPGFDGLDGIEGHKRVVSYGTVGSRWAIALRGRVHLNERPYDAGTALMVRLQIQMLCELGVRTFVLTNAAGALGDKAAVGEVVAVDGFVSLFAPDRPTFAGEFVSPDDVLDEGLRRIALAQAPEGLTVREGGYVMLRGSSFEGRKYDKPILRTTGASCVGMSSLPETDIIALYRPQARALVLSYITNDDVEEHSHEANLAQAKSDAPKLAELLTRIASKT